MAEQPETDKQIANPHDLFFKEMLSRREVASHFLAHYLPPEIAKLLDLTTLGSSKETFVDSALRAHYSDMLYTVKMRTGAEAYVYMLFEHKSYPDRQIAFQLLRYMVRIWEQALRQGKALAPIFPITVYHGSAPWQVGVHLSDLIHAPAELMPFLPDYRYWLFDLSQYSDADLKTEVMSGVVLLTMKYIMRPELRERLGEILNLVNILGQQETGLSYLEVILRYLTQGTDQITGEELREAMETLFPEGGILMGTIAEKWLEEGRQQGLQRGLQQGLQQGIREGLLSGIELGLDLRFGAKGLRILPEIYKIEDVGVLRAIQEGLKTGKSLAEIQHIFK